MKENLSEEYPLHRRIYNKHLKGVTEAMGLHQYVAHTYTSYLKKKQDFARKLSNSKMRLRHMFYDKDSIEHEINGTKIELPAEEFHQYRRFHRMFGELEMFEEILDEARPGDVFFDVGAYLGWHAVVVNSVPDVDVFSFEPHPVTATQLQNVLDWTGDEDVEVHQVALFDEEGTVEFSENPKPGARISEGNETIEVKTLTGDSLVMDGEIPPPDIMKIDAESVEAAVLRGFRETIETHKPRIIYCEVHEQEEGGEVKQLLDELGYEYEPFIRTNTHILKAVPR